MEAAVAKHVAENLAQMKDEAGAYLYGRKRISDATGLSDKEVRKVFESIGRKGEPWSKVPTPPVMETHPEPAPYQVVPTLPPKMRSAYLDAYEAFKLVIGKDAEAFLPTRRPSNERWAVFSDVHLPFHNEAWLVAACDRAEAEGCGGLILAGDTFDFYRMSRYLKTKELKFEEEMAKARVAFEYLCSRFPKVRIFLGNHEIGRWERWLAEYIHEEFRFLVKNPIDLLLNGIPNLEVVGHTTTWGKELVWLYQLGEDAILTHCEKSSAQQGVNLEKLKLWLREWARPLGINRNFRLVTSGHTHRLTMIHDDDCLAMETGMLADWTAQEYMVGAQVANKKPGVPGFVIVQQENGITDLSECKTIRLNP